MSATTMLVMIGYAFAMACGQILFKKAALVASASDAAIGLRGFVSVYLVVGIILYAVLTGVWVWILRSVPLSLAYPFVALAFVFTPVMASLIFAETLSRGYVLGMAFIVVGVVVIARQ